MKYLQRVLARAKQRRDEGATAVEYVLLVAFVAVALAVGASFLAQTLNGALDNASNTIMDGGQGGGGGEGDGEGDFPEEPVE